MILELLAILAGVATVAAWASLRQRRRARAFEEAWWEAQPRGDLEGDDTES